MAIAVTALLPFFAAVLVGKVTIDRLGALAATPELGVALENSLGVYADLATALKEGMRHEGAAMAADPALAEALRTPGADDDATALRALVATHPRTVSLAIEPADDPGAPGPSPAGVERDAPSPVRVERDPPGVDRDAKQLTVRARVPGSPAELVAVLATPGARFAEQERLAAFERAYRELESSRRSAYVERPYLVALTVVMVLTLALAAFVGALVARPVTRGVARLTEALRQVAGGDLEPRVRFEAEDELGALGRTFNAAILELERSRARLEFLRHMGEWQKVARRLAHEIRNPLTPIQLAVQECQRRYQGADDDFARLLATTVEVVEEEVASLRRLVGRFARFARLPDAELTPCDLTAVLREQSSHFTVTDRVSTTGSDDDDTSLVDLDVDLEVPAGPLPVLLDREMFHRALLNLVRNAAQAIRDARAGAPGGGPAGRVRIRAGRDDDGVWVAVDDDGPGIAPAVRTSLFDPYVTTKRDGSGLGLSIVKKIALDHGGRVEAGVSPEGGARLTIRLPAAPLESPAAINPGGATEGR